jgi:hypothetical protein
MLAYVFWHWPQESTERSVYEAYLARFHEALGKDAPEGFVSSSAFRISNAPWLPRKTAYEDWYLVTDFDALGNLNEAAVTASREQAHGDVASYADGGTGGLYLAIAGQARLRPVRFAAWMSKPRGVPYGAFLGALAARTSQPDITLWQRQLTLGPAPEFCLHTVEKHDLEVEAQWVELAAVESPHAAGVPEP